MKWWFYPRTFYGMLYPAYYSYKAVKTKDVKEYVHWMMYWIVFSIFSVFEVVVDTFIGLCLKIYIFSPVFEYLRNGFMCSKRFPFYYELKILFMIWLMSPTTRGGSTTYCRFIHPFFTRHEMVRKSPFCQMMHLFKQIIINCRKSMITLPSLKSGLPIRIGNSFTFGTAISYCYHWDKSLNPFVPLLFI
jgi:hypothetical protein